MNSIFYQFVILIISFIFTVLLTKMLIPRLKIIAKQPIYEEGPSWHITKSGTPTMGGIGFIFVISVILLTYVVIQILNGNGEWPSITFSLSFALCNCFVGVIDDITKLKRANNGGLTPKQKILLQTLFSVLFLAGRKMLFNDDTLIAFGQYAFDFGIFYYLIAFIFLLGMINCANLTDGVDGLAGLVAFVIFGFFLVTSVGARNDTSIISATAIGGILGFLIFNIHPAKVFMGDTGSLFLGALIASLAFFMKAIPSGILAGGVYVIEGASVIMQVLYFKKTKKRLFKMAPLHHHLEKSGFDESTICIIGILITCIFSLIAYMLLPKV